LTLAANPIKLLLAFIVIARNVITAVVLAIRSSALVGKTCVFGGGHGQGVGAKPSTRKASTLTAIASTAIITADT
tara:strand:+ start:326 stop:550 length:225 start_codon:yes stop_codon:yes gene_type:complete